MDYYFNIMRGELRKKRTALNPICTNTRYNELYHSKDFNFFNYCKNVELSGELIHENLGQSTSSTSNLEQKLFKNFEGYLKCKYFLKGRTRISSSEYGLRQDHSKNSSIGKHSTAKNLKYLRNPVTNRNDKNDAEIITAHRISRCNSDGSQVIYEEYTVSSCKKQSSCHNPSNIIKTIKRTVIHYNHRHDINAASDNIDNAYRTEYHPHQNEKSLDYTHQRNLNRNKKLNKQVEKTKIVNQSPPVITNSDADDCFEDAVDGFNTTCFTYDRNEKLSSLESEDQTASVGSNSTSLVDDAFADTHAAGSSDCNEESTVNISNKNRDSSCDPLMRACSEDEMVDSTINIPWSKIFPTFNCQLHYPHREIWWISSALVNVCRTDSLFNNHESSNSKEKTDDTKRDFYLYSV